MEQENVLTPPAGTGENPVFDLALWVGRHQAFGLIANKCAAADAHSLREIRDRKLYRALDLDWKEFCTRYGGVCYKTADQIIDRLEEFGESYFNLSQLIAIRTADYRAIAPAVENNTVEFEGQQIPIDREHTEALLEAVRTLRKQAEKAKKEASPLDRIDTAFDQTFGRIGGILMRGGISEELRTALVNMMMRVGILAANYRHDLLLAEKKEPMPES